MKPDETMACPARSGGDRVSDPAHPENCRLCNNTGRVPSVVCGACEGLPAGRAQECVACNGIGRVPQPKAEGHGALIPSDARYLDALATAYLAAPEGSREERDLDIVLGYACKRLGVDRRELVRRIGEVEMVASEQEES
jgi:hypothetical protein